MPRYTREAARWGAWPLLALALALALGIPPPQPDADIHHGQEPQEAEQPEPVKGFQGTVSTMIA